MPDENKVPDLVLGLNFHMAQTGRFGAPYAVSPDNTPAPAKKIKRFFSYDGAFTFMRHDTEAEAKEKAEEWLEGYRDDAADGWPDEAAGVCWGEVKGWAKITSHKVLCGIVHCDGECGNPNVHHSSAHDIELDFTLQPVDEVTP